MEVQSRNSDDNSSPYRNSGITFRNSVLNALNYLRNGHNYSAVPVLDSEPRKRRSSDLKRVDSNNNTEKLKSDTSLKIQKTLRNTVINIVLVEAKGLPALPNDGSSHGVYVKFSSGHQSLKSKIVQNTRNPQWRERITLNLYHDHLLNISSWDKGKRKNFMGSCVLDLSTLEKERTHDIWQDLDNGYGSIHLSITMYTEDEVNHEPSANEQNLEDGRCQYGRYNFSTSLAVVGQLQVKVIGAKGLHGKINAYCMLELDNERIQTPKVHSAEPMWNKTFVFNIYDVTSVLELKVADGSRNSILNNVVGRISIPLLRIEDGVPRWYALKDSSKRKSAKGNCPRVQLEMTLVWNPVVASLKIFRPKQVKYIAEQPKFDLALVYKNIKFVRDTFDFLYRFNEGFKNLFEWDDSEFTKTAIVTWLVFWYYYVGLWMTPLLIIALFAVIFYTDQNKYYESSVKAINIESAPSKSKVELSSTDVSLTGKVKGLPEMTITITNGIDYLVSVAERLHNLATFQVPFLSFLTILILLGSSIVLYFVPFNYLMMIFGIYKFGRKYLYPDRIPNNDLLDFISRIPDNEMLKDWKELNVPEPPHPKSEAGIRMRVHQSAQQAFERAYDQNKKMENAETSESTKL